MDEALGERGEDVKSCLLLHAVLCWANTDKIAYNCFFY